MLPNYRLWTDSFAIGVGLTAISIAIAGSFGLITNIWDMNPVELFAVFMSFACTYMCVMQSRWNYVLAVICTITWSYVFWQANLLGSMAVNLYLIPTVIAGWFFWGQDGVNSKPVQHVAPRSLWKYAAWTAGTYFGAAYILDYFDASMAPLDAWLLIGTILAQFLMDRKKIETWVVWGVVNIASIYVYFNAGLYLTAIQFVFFLGNSFYGVYEWNRTMRHDQKLLAMN